MRLIELNSTEAESLLKTCFKNRSLIPIIGAGFTMGCRTKNRTVPDGPKLKEIMTDAILTNSQKLSDKKELLNKRDFKGISEIFQNDTHVPKNIVKNIINEYFIEVILPKEKIDFLCSGWPYIYTFNIDDAIERNGPFKPVIPYLKISNDSKKIKCVYKLHGDASHEVIYDEATSLIFSSSQYVRSLIKNDSMILFLSNDIYENNIIFIGCSLNNEIDLMYAVVGMSEKPIKETNRIYVTDRRPNEIDEIDLETYNIDTVLLVDNYDNFYKTVNHIYQDLGSELQDPLCHYLANKIQTLPKTKDSNIDYLLKADASLDVCRHLTKPFYLVEREVKCKILESALRSPLTIIRGRRFSGKTLLLQDIAVSIKNKTVFFFPSITSISDEFFIKIFHKKDSVFVFDTNVLDFNKAMLIRSNIKRLEEKSSSVIIACNPSETDVANTFIANCEDESFFELDNRFTGSETDQLNNKLSQLGIINWNKTKNILDNTYFMQESYPSKKAQIVQQSQLNDEEIKSIIILCIFDKTYSTITRAINLSHNDLQALVQKLHPLLDIEITSPIESHHHSKYKVIANSKAWLFKLVADYYVSNSNNKIVNLIIDLVKAFHNNSEYKYLSEKLIMFDNLNQIFGGRKGGVAHLILELYKELQNILFADPDYWLQRAKAILKLDYRTVEEVNDGIDYAKKALNDGKRDKTIINAEFTIALLYGKLCKLNKYSDIEQVKDCVEWFYRAINNNQFNRDYVDSVIKETRGQKGYFYHFCKYLSQECTDIRLLEKKEKVNFLCSHSGINA